MSGRTLTPEQTEAVELRDGPLLLAANAGSGKTTVLVERFVRSVTEDGIDAAAILAITFTEKAAGELRSRIRERFAQLGRQEEARDVAGAWVSTIHGFCQRVLRAHAVSAGLDPAFTVLDASEARALRALAFDDALAGWLADSAERLDVAAAYGVQRLRRMVEGAHDELRSRGMPIALVAPPPPDLAAAHAALLRVAAAFAEELAGAKAGKTVDAAREALARCATLGPSDEAPAVGRQANALKTELADAYRRACATHAQAVADVAVAAALPHVDALLRGFGAAYAARRTRRAALDFADLELRARDLLLAEPAIARGYAGRFGRVMVDEFQDTNPLQLEVIAAVAPEHRFVVGDELQSIYGFRHADVEVFRGERARLLPAGRARELRTNFRSRPEILAALDAAFAAGHGEGAVPFTAGRKAAADGPRIELLLTDEQAWRELAETGDPLADRVAAGLPGAPPQTAAEARAVARRAAELVREGTAPGDIVVLLRAVANMAVFERALQAEGLATLPSVGRGWWGRQEVLDLTAWLGAIANPRDEPALLGALASPLGGLSSDGLALLALARRRWSRAARLWDVVGAVAGGSEEVPAEASEVLAALGRDDREAIARFTGRLAAARERAPRVALPALLHEAVATTGYDAHLLGLAGGRRRLANAHKLVRLAAAFEARRGRDLRGFIDHARAELDAEALETDAPVDLAGEDAVRLMTIHAAKGLEFGVVFLADLGRLPPDVSADLLLGRDATAGLRLRTIAGDNLKSSVFIAERDRRRAADAAETRRVMHVAFTRAEERLVLSGAACLDPLPDTGGLRTSPLAWVARELVGDPAALDPQAAVVERPAGGDGPPVRVVRNAPDHAAQVLGIEATAGEQLGMLVDDADPAPREPGPAEAPAAGPPVVDVAALPALPAHLSYSALGDHAACGYRFYLTRLAGLPSVEPPPHLRRPPDPGRLEGRVRGTLVHQLLEHGDLVSLPGEEEVRALAAELELDPSAEAVADVRRLVAAALGSPLVARLRAAPRLHRERAFTFPLGPTLLTGFVDVLAFEAGGTAIVADWKTDWLAPGADPGLLAEADYGTQRAVYGLAALRAGAPAVEVVHLFLEDPDRPATVRFGPDDAPALEARLLTAAEGVLGHDFRPAPEPHAGLCAACPGRGGLCHHPTELTDRILGAPADPATAVTAPAVRTPGLAPGAPGPRP